jgi:hypothetical protein
MQHNHEPLIRDKQAACYVSQMRIRILNYSLSQRLRVCVCEYSYLCSIIMLSSRGGVDAEDRKHNVGLQSAVPDCQRSGCGGWLPAT